jgi:phosphinothricin acetyltransferase
MIRNVKMSDAKDITEIYNYYIENTVITFQTDLLSVEETEKKIEEILLKGFPYIVYEENNEVIGYAYAGVWRDRKAYEITLETSIYLDQSKIKKGIGRQLYKELIERSRQIGVHSLIGVVSVPNEGSKKLHLEFGFELLGTFKEVGQKFNKYVSVEFWQLML